MTRCCPWWAIVRLGGARCILLAGHAGAHADAEGNKWTDNYGVREHGEREDDRIAGHSGDQEVNDE